MQSLPLKFISSKIPNWERVQSFLADCSLTNKWSNFGPVSDKLERLLTSQLKLDDDLSVVMTASGTSALHALAQMHSYLNGKQLKWLTSSFSFPCLNQGPLQNSVLVDCDEDCMLDLNKINQDFDGMIVTNIFGSQLNCNKYNEFCKGKILIVDSATGFDNVEHFENEFISFHHTKPWGFGEGGCAIVSKKNERLFRSIINFGIQTNSPSLIAKWSSNFKMSEVSAAFILDRIMQSDLHDYRQQFDRISKLLPFKFVETISTMGYVTFISDQPIQLKPNHLFEIKKYYKPIDESVVANEVFSKILCVPCYPEMAMFSDEQIVDALGI